MSETILKPELSARTLIEALRVTCDLEDSKGITYIQNSGEEEWISYHDLWNLSATYGYVLKASGVKPGDRVAIILDTSKDFLGAFWGAMYVGAIPFALYPPSLMVNIDEYQAKTRRILDLARPKAIVTMAVIRSVVANCLDELPETALLVEKDFEGQWSEDGPIQRSPSDTAFLQFTSGSTTLPRGVVLTHDNVIANIKAIAKGVQMTPDDVGVSWLPPFHDMGLIGKVLQCVHENMKLVWMSPMYFLKRPVRWLQAISKHGGTLSAAPNFAYALCVRKVKEKHMADLDLSTWRVAFNGAEPVDPETTEAFMKKFGEVGFKRSTMFPVYGLAESALAVTFPDLGTEPKMDTVNREVLAEEGRAEQVDEGTDHALQIPSCGKAVHTTQVKVVDEMGKEKGECEVGEVIFSGPSMCKGYYKNEEYTKDLIRDGWVYTGDLGYIRGENLYVTGRKKDMIIIRGRNYLPQDIEMAAQEAEGIRKGRVVAFSVKDEKYSTEFCVVAAEANVKDPEKRIEIADDVTKRVQHSIGLRPKVVVILNAGAIPRTSSGKIQRSLTKKLYLDGQLTGRARNNQWIWLFRLWWERVRNFFRWITGRGK